MTFDLEKGNVVPADIDWLEGLIAIVVENCASNHDEALRSMVEFVALEVDAEERRVGMSLQPRGPCELRRCSGQRVPELHGGPIDYHCEGICRSWPGSFQNLVEGKLEHADGPPSRGVLVLQHELQHVEDH